MAATVIVILGLVVVTMCVAVAILGKKAKDAAEQEAATMAAAFAREATEQARRKADAAATAAVDQIKGATHEELLRIARDLAKRD